jgi:hypothetical protein
MHPRHRDISCFVRHSLRFSWTAYLDGLGELTDVTVATMREEEIGGEIAGVSSIRAAFRKRQGAREEDSRRVVDDTDLGRHD